MRPVPLTPPGANPVGPNHLSVKPATRKTILAVIAVVAVLAVVLRGLGRVWWCECGSPALWSRDIWSSHNSQHLLDPYSFTHFLHGLVFYFLLWAALRRVAPVATRGALALVIEALWEMVENTDFLIERYRQSTISLDYYGDCVLNSLGDLLACGLGYLVAAWIPTWASVALFVLIEGVLLAWIRDSLILNVWMLLVPSEAIKQWQMGKS